MIEVERLTKRFGARVAVDAVSFAVRKGDILGLLGPNGAGKTTTMRMITGFFPPDEGTVRICGFDPEEQPIEARARIGYLPENAPSYDDMTVEAFLAFVAEVRGFQGAERRRRIEALLEECL
ncbi:MAG: ABC transporter ATP-binding protein, partial [Kiritimatiellia bacterium]|nr:ABC transporter ATP-binding protein [Kiritimatiellia bacterium]